MEQTSETIIYRQRQHFKVIWISHLLTTSINLDIPGGLWCLTLLSKYIVRSQLHISLKIKHIIN